MNTINLLPWRENNRKKYAKLLNLEIVAVIIFTLLIIIASHIFRSSAARFYTKENALFSQDIQRLNNENAQLTPFQEQEKLLNKNINAIYSLQFHRYIGVKVLNIITAITPKEIYLTKLKFDRHDIEVAGNAASNIAISRFVDNLDKTHFFKPAKIAEVAEQKTENLTVTKFVITATVNSDYQPAAADEKKP